MTLAKPEDVPEGASPRCFDCDFDVGSVKTRDGLVSNYTFATVLIITGVVIYGGIATFTYTGIEPTINEEFLFSGFTGDLAFLNETTGFVVSSTIITFDVDVPYSDMGPFTGLSGLATSLSGTFVGPNLGTIAVNASTDGNPWVNPNGILGNATYASVTIGTTGSATKIPGTAANDGIADLWTSPGNIFSSSVFATVVLSIAANSPPQPPPSPGPPPPSGGGGGGGTGGGGGGGKGEQIL